MLWSTAYFLLFSTKNVCPFFFFFFFLRDFQRFLGDSSNLFLWHPLIKYSLKKLMLKIPVGYDLTSVRYVGEHYTSLRWLLYCNFWCPSSENQYKWRKAYFALEDLRILFFNMFNRHANVQHIDLKVPLFGRGDISKDLKSILVTIRYSTSPFFCSSPLPIFKHSLQVPWIKPNTTEAPG